MKLSSRSMLGIGIGLALTTATLGIVYVAQFSVATSPTPDNSAAPAPKDRLITALGRVEPQGEVIKVGGPTGERILKLLVTEGQQVTKGQPIAYLESYPERLSERQYVASQLREAQALLASEQRLGKAQIQQARIRQAQVSQPKAKEIVAQEATIERLKAERLLAQKDYQRFEYLQSTGAVSIKDLEDRALALRSRQEELNNAQATLEQLSLQLQTDFASATAQVDMAAADTARSQIQAQVASVTSNLQLADARLARTIIVAPQAGQVLKVLIKEGEAISIGSGQATSSETTIIELGNTKRMVVVAEVYETDIRHVKVGQAATISSPAFEDQLHGTVQKIGLQIAKNDVLDTDPAADTDARVIEVEIALLNGFPVAQLTNLQVDVKIRPEG